VDDALRFSLVRNFQISIETDFDSVFWVLQRAASDRKISHKLFIINRQCELLRTSPHVRILHDSRDIAEIAQAGGFAI
jgi:hypothetical protein